ncbi:MAG: carbamate kinase [Syntrophobacteraceae bacterium]|nr:carbamate kinase [Desulfobacteraceae bacterium]
MEASAGQDILLVALGGNALVRKGQTGTAQEQFDNLHVPVRQIARLSRHYRILITHGNGPQVGNLLLQQECCRAVPPMPLEILGAQTQGQIGYMIESTLDSELMELGIQTEQLLVSLISYVVVDTNDPAFLNPSKPIGPVLSGEAAAAAPYPVRMTAKGYRRVVASPRPVSIVEKREIQRLIDMGFIVICCGGGGIPVVRDGRAFAGVDAVIDKDLASAVLAAEIGVSIFLMATDVDGVALDFGTPSERFVRRMSVMEAERHLREGQFPPGSMGPKVEAAIQFLRSGGARAVIASIDMIEKAVAGAAGTEFVL